MEAKLHLIKGNPKGKQVVVPEGTFTIGRAEDRDLILASTRVSRHHCEILNGPDGIVVRDLGSGNGTFVNGKKIQEQKLEPGDHLSIGPLTFLVEIEGVKEKPKPAAPEPGAAPKPAPKPAAAKPAAKPQAKPAAKAKTPFPVPGAAKPKTPKVPKPPRRRVSEDEILASLEAMAAPKKKEDKEKKPEDAEPKLQDDEGDDDVLTISEDDLLE